MRRVHLLEPHSLLLTIWATATLFAPLSAAPAAGQETPDWAATLEAIVAQESESKGFPSFAIVVADVAGSDVEVVWGRVEPDGPPATATTLYRTGSVGKTLTDLSVLRAVEAGVLELDTDIRTYLPEFQPASPFGEPITLRRLMTHTAGLVREPPVGNYFDASSPSLAATVESLNGTTLLWAPGTRTKYSNAALAVVGRALEAKYDEPYETVLRRLVFDPASMRTAEVGTGPRVTASAARGIMQRPDGSIWPAPTFDLGMVPAGDLYASIQDMAALMHQLLDDGGDLLTPETFRLMWMPDPPLDDWQLDVGLGFSLNGRFAGRYRMARHGGAVYGFATELALLPEEGLGVYAVAAKDLANGTVQAVAQWALLAALAARAGEPPPEYALTPTPFQSFPARLAACTTDPDDLPGGDLLGVYGPDHNPLTICRSDGRLNALVEWYFLYPLETPDDGGYRFPSYALYGHERLWFEREDGSLVAVIGVGDRGVRFRRR